MGHDDRFDAPFPVTLLHGPTAAEARILEMVALGLSTAEIGQRLWVTPAAVTFHIGNLIRKLGAENRTGMIARAYALGLLRPATWPPQVDPEIAGVAVRQRRVVS